DLSDQMIRRHYLVEIKRVKELLLSTLSPPHHGSTPANHLSIRRNHGSPVASTTVLQHIPPESRQTADVSICPLCAKSGRTRRSKISYSITARSEVERIALKIGASAGRALSHRQRLRGLSLIQRISSNLNGLCLRHVLSNGKSSRRTLRCSE